MRWKDLKLWKKMTTGIGSVLLLLIAISIWSIMGLSEVVTHGQEVAAGNALQAEMLQREVDHLNWAKKLSVYLLDDNMRELDVELDHTQCGFGKWYYGEGRKKAQELLPSLKQSLDEIEEPHKHLHASASRIKEVYSKGTSEDGRKAAEAVFASETQSNLKQVQDHLMQMNEMAKKNLISDTEMLSDAKQTHIITILISIVAVFIGICVGWLITRSISKPIVQGVAFAQSIAAGDLSQSLDVNSKDELGELANALNSMVTGLREMVGKIKDNSSQVASAADEISAGSMQLTKATHNQSSAAEETSATMVQMSASIQTVAANADSLATNVDEVSSAVQELGASSEQVSKSAEVMASSVAETSASIEQMTVSIDRVAQSAEELASSVTETSSTIEQMTVSIDQVAGNTQELQQVSTDTAATVEQLAISIRESAKNVTSADDVAKAAAKEGAAGQEAVQQALAAMERVGSVIDKTALSITNLGKRSEEIGSIVKVINEIADQTNLLALNAAIEAARAGDAGRGFAVVAEEVRKLAERSVNATKEIGEVIKQVQADTGDSVKYGELAAQEARASMELSGAAGNALANMVRSIEQTSRLMSEIALMTGEQNNASGQVLKSVERMTQATAQVASAAREQAQGGKQIRVAVERMNTVTQEVTGATREQALGSRQIRIAVENMNNVTQQVSIATKEQALSAKQIVEAINSMNTMTVSVANATAEQKKGGEMVVQAVENISDSARENLASVEQLSRSAQGLSQQAADLAGMVAQFKVQKNS